MRILFVFTGGTIGSTLDGNVISTDESKAYRIIEAYRDRYGIDFEYDMIEPYTALSENNTGDTVRVLCESVREKLGCGYDGIILTHGTDTLAYSSAALGYALGLDTIPVCIVSSNRPIEHERANALDNLYGAVSFIRGGCGHGCFVVYRNDNSSTVRVHRATRLLGPKAYSDDVSSIGGCVYGHFDASFNFVRNDSYRECADVLQPIPTASLGESSDAIMMIQSYPGMRYPTLDRDVRYVIVNTYHSGTLDTLSERARSFYLSCKERGIAVFATGVSEGPNYASAEEFLALGITAIANISPVSAYMKIWMLTSAELDVVSLTDSLSGDIMI